MILADTSVWVDHLRREDADLRRHLEAGMVLIHPFVLGEIACGTFPQRPVVLDLLGKLPRAVMAAEREVLTLIESRRLMGRGLGYVDIHLLASTQLTAAATLWTRDRRLAEAARRLGIAA